MINWHGNHKVYLLANKSRDYPLVANRSGDVIV